MGKTRLTYLGHATVLIETGRLKILTDPILRQRVAGVLRSAPIDLRSLEAGLDAVVISHAHYDHLHELSLRLLERSTRVIVPRGLGQIVKRLGFKNVDEVRVGDVLNIDQVAISVVKADHSGQRPPLGPTAQALGYVIEGEQRVYFAGDTDIYRGHGGHRHARCRATSRSGVGDRDWDRATWTRAARPKPRPCCGHAWPCPFTGAPSTRSACAG